MKLIYRKLKGYKYDVRAVFKYPLPRFERILFKSKFLTLQDGVLTVEVGYAWDGPSGPTIDTEDSMGASLIHDALYQIMREGGISRDVYRKYADELLRDIFLATMLENITTKNRYLRFIQKSMAKTRANAWYFFVRKLGKKSSEARLEPRGKIVTVHVNENFK